MEDASSRCNHAGCQCELGPDEMYCSDYCEKEIHSGMDPQAMTCRCGHEPCGSREDPAVHT